MKKNKFEAPVMEVILFDLKDIVTTSGGSKEEGEGEIE